VLVGVSVLMSHFVTLYHWTLVPSTFMVHCIVCLSLHEVLLYAYNRFYAVAYLMVET